LRAPNTIRRPWSTWFLGWIFWAEHALDTCWQMETACKPFRNVLVRLKRLLQTPCASPSSLAHTLYHADDATPFISSPAGTVHCLEEFIGRL
jgi:hypothetical protein